MGKITVNKMQEMVDTYVNGHPELSEKYAVLKLGEAEIMFDTELSFNDRRIFVERVVSAVVNENGYFPEMLDVMLFTTALQMMTDVSVPTKSAVVGGESVKVLDFKRLQEWYYGIEERWYGLSDANLNLDRLFCEVNKRISWELEKKKQDTPFNKLFQKMADAIDHLSEENGVGLVELAEMMRPQLRDKKDEEVSVQYGADGVMEI